MNFLILVNNAPKYKYFYFQIAQKLVELGHSVSYAVDSVRSTFLEPLSEIDDNKSTYFFDKFLEKNWNNNITLTLNDKEYWGDIFYSDFDRFLTHNYNLNRDKSYWINIKQNLDSFFDKIIIENNIDCVIYENVSNTFAYMAYKKCQELNKKYVGLMMSRLPEHFEIQNSIIDKEIEKIKILAQKEPKKEELEWFYSYKENISSIQPDYMKSNGLDNVSLLRLLTLKKFKQFYDFFTLGLKYNHKYDFQFGNPYRAIYSILKRNINRYINTKLSDKYYLSKSDLDKEIEQDIFYVYPIHYHPESSTSVLAPEYTNEYTNIINIANNLPFGTFLYVKNHKSAKGVQSIDFYRKVSALPNVKLINYDVNIKTLIIKSKGVITVNSTAGYEALLLDKSVFLLGRVFYECFPNVVKLSNFKAIRNISKVSYEKDVSSYFIAYKNYCYFGKLAIKENYDVNDKENLMNIAIAIQNNAQE